MLWALLIFILCAIPGHDIPHVSFLELLEFDKFVHAGLFFVLVALLAKGFSMQDTVPSLKRFPLPSAFVICVTYGGALELMQGAFFSERTADIYDFIANSFGSVVGWLLFSRLDRKLLPRLVK